jgi:hypothetical protein
MMPEKQSHAYSQGVAHKSIAGFSKTVPEYIRIILPLIELPTRFLNLDMHLRKRANTCRTKPKRVSESYALM